MKFIKNRFYFVTGIISFAVYLLTSAPSIIQIDSGELAAVQINLGIAHPTGYPLFTIIGYLFSLLPLPFTKIFQMNLLAAIFCSTGVGVFTYTISLILRNLDKFTVKSLNTDSKKSKKETKKNSRSERANNAPVLPINENGIIITSIISGFILAFSRTFWFQSTSVEVYSLHILLLSLILLTLLKAFITGEKTEGKLTKEWLVFSLILALGFTNHMTTLLILPATAYLYFIKNKFSKASFLLLAKMIGCFLVLFTGIYLYLPVRGSMEPLFNWGNPVDLERILRHISGHQYQVWLFSSSEKARKHLTDFINGIPKEFYISLFFIATGLIVSISKRLHLFAFTIIALLFTVVYSVNYDINDLESYFLLAYFAMTIFAGLGIYELYLFFHSNKKLQASAQYGFIGLICIFLGIQLFVNFGKVDQSDNYLFEDYTKAVIDGTTNNAIILSAQWDFFVSGSYYYQSVENFRNDVTIIDKELLRRSWYFRQITKDRPWLLESIQPEMDQFIEALKPFERDEKFDAALLEKLYRTIISKIIRNNIDKRDVFIGNDLMAGIKSGEVTIPEGYTLIPDNLLLKVVRVDSNAYYAEKEINYQPRQTKVKNSYTDFILKNSADLLTQRAIYEFQHNNKEKAKRYVNKIITFLPEYNFPNGFVQAISN